MAKAGSGQTRRYSKRRVLRPGESIRADENNKTYYNFFVFLNILYVTELPEVFLTLGIKLRLVLSFFTLRRDFMDFQLLNVQRLRIISIMMRIISITKRGAEKLWKISAGRKFIIKIA